MRNTISAEDGPPARQTGGGDLTPTDWHLLRKCPCPVWMVKDQPWPEGGKRWSPSISPAKRLSQHPNEKLVRETLSLAEEVNHTEVHLIGAYPVTPINIAIELPDLIPASTTTRSAASICWR